MPRRTPLDPALGPAFTVGDGLERGHSASRLRGADLTVPFHGVRTRHEVDMGDLVQRATAYAPLLRRGERLSGTTALALWGAPLPPSDLALHVTGAGGRRPRRAGVIGHRSAPVAAATRHGLPVSPPAVAFTEAAGELAERDLVAAGDFLVHDPRVLDPLDIRPHVSIEELRAHAEAAAGRNVRAARHAAARVREGVESRTETLLRLLLTDAGLPDPDCGVAIRDQRGRHIGWFDLVWSERRVIVEYDGDQHRTSTAQYEKDIRRFDRATDAGYRVLRVRSHGLFRDPAETIARVRGALAR